MLKPAILYKEELEKAFAERIYSEDYFYYNGYAFCYDLPIIEARDCYRQYAVVHNNKLLGFLTYHIDSNIGSVSRFGLIAFEKNNPVFVTEIYNAVKDILRQFPRMEWRVICGNPVEKVYDKICEAYGGVKYVLHNCCLDNVGRFRNSAIYEIVK